MRPSTLISQVALIVAQSRDRQNRLSGIKLTSLGQGLQRIAVAAKKMKGNKKRKRYWTANVQCNVVK